MTPTDRKAETFDAEKAKELLRREQPYAGKEPLFVFLDAALDEVERLRAEDNRWWRYNQDQEKEISSLQSETLDLRAALAAEREKTLKLTTADGDEVAVSLQSALAEIERLQRAYDSAETACVIYDRDITTLRAALAAEREEKERTRKALETYGEHLDSCTLVELNPGKPAKWICDCGLTAALAAGKEG